jgi:hypothetical protein
MQTKPLESKKKKLLDFLYAKRQRARSNMRIAKNQNEEEIAFLEVKAYNEVILFVVQDPCMEWLF